MDHCDRYYTFSEVLYGLSERRAGKSMPIGSDELEELRVRLSLKMPSVRDDTITEIARNRQKLKAQHENNIFLAMEETQRSKRPSYQEATSDLTVADGDRDFDTEST